MALADRFAQNVELWARTCPKEALLLPYLDLPKLSCCQTEEGEENFLLPQYSKKVHLHAQAGARREAIEWLSSLDLTGVDVLYIYGIGLGYYYDELLSWLKESSKHIAVFLEDDLAVLAEFFKTERASHLLQDRQVYLVYVRDMEEKAKGLDEIYWDFALTKAAVTGLSSYCVEKSVAYQQLCHEISYSSDLKKALLEEYLDYGGHYFMNCYRNFMWIAQSYLGDRLFGHFKGTPAIICGAGPSLEKNGPLLREFEGRALIFAGGSSINILNRLGVQPHFCAGIDPNEAQQVRLRSNQAFEVPYFYRQRLNYSAFRTVHAPLLYVTGSGGYDIAEYLEESLDIPTTPFEEGHNVINFAMELAYQMGCNPILFVGMDLAFTDCKTYSAGVTFDIDLEKRSLDQYANFETAGLKRQDIDGKPIYTLWKWVAESEWIGAWAKEHPDCSLINCTEGGIGFPGVAMQTLKEAALGLLGGQWDLHGQIHTEIQNAKMPQVTEERVEAVVRELRQSLSRCSQNIDFLDEDLERIKKLTQREMRPFPHAQSGKAALVELELSEEPAWRAVLDIFNQVSARLLNKELVQIRYSEEELPEWQKNIQRMEIMQKRLRFLRNVSTVNAEIIDYAVAEHAKEREFPKTMSREVMELFPLSKDRQFSCSIDKQSFHRDGAWRVYYDSGALKGVSHYNAGVLQGVSQFFTEQGQLLSNSYFQYGQRQGEQLCYYASGALYSRQQFEQGRPHGQQLYYYENGKLRTVLEYVQGQLVGEALLYNEQGDLKRHIAFNTNHSE